MKNFFRIIHIAWIIHRYFSLSQLIFFKRLRHKITCSSSRAEAVRMTLENLGPIFVKLGQAISMRKDLIPEDIAQELSKLQDQVPPFDGNHLKQTYQHLFESFDLIPLASASIAQVHAAMLKTGQQVVIKALRPHIEKHIKRDIAFMYTCTRLGGKIARQFKLKDIVAEFEISTLGELDLLKEAASASQLKRNFKYSQSLYIPEIYWEYTSSDIMVMERIHGIPIRDKNALRQNNVNLKKLAEKIIEIFFTQVFRDSFFHADMHSGNIFVSYEHPENPQIITVDFGIMGSLNPDDQRYIAENFLAFFKRDYRRVAVLHVESGWAPSHTRIDQLESAVRTVCEPIFEKPLGEISFGQLLLKLIHMAAQFDIQIQPQLVLLQKTLLSVEGLARDLYPELDLWKTAKPFLERWIKTQIGPKAFLRKIKAYMPIWLEKLPDFPHLVYELLEQTLTEKRNPKRH